MEGQRGFLLALIRLVESAGWERALKRAKRDDFGTAGTMVAQHCTFPPDEEEFLRVLQSVCEGAGLSWSEYGPKWEAWGEFICVRIPVNEVETPEEVVMAATSAGDQLGMLLRSRFATSGGDLASTYGRAASEGSVEVFALCRPSHTTVPAATGVYCYFDELGVVKEEQVNVRAGELAVACGCRLSSPLCGDVYIGRVRMEPSPARATDFTLDDLTPSAAWLANAPAENALYSQACLELGPRAELPSGGGDAAQDHDAAQARSMMHSVFTGVQAPLTARSMMHSVFTGMHSRDALGLHRYASAAHKSGTPRRQPSTASHRAVERAVRRR